MTVVRADDPLPLEGATHDDPAFATPLPGALAALGGPVPFITLALRAREDIELLLTRDELDRLLRQAVAAAEASPGWAAGREFVHVVTDDAHVFDGFEPSSFTLVHRGSSYDVRYYDGFSTEYIE